MRRLCSGATCTAEVEFALVTSRAKPAGIPHPVDPDSIGGDAGTIALTRDTGTGELSGRFLTKAQPITGAEQRAVSHYATCPDASRFR